MFNQKRELMQSSIPVVKTNETIQIGDYSVNIYYYNERDDKPLLFLIQDINMAVYGSLKNDVNKFYKTHKSDGRFIWKFNKKWEIYQSNTVDQKSTVSTIKQDHIFFTEEGLYKCMVSTNGEAGKKFQEEHITILKEIRTNKLGIKVNDPSSVIN